MLAVEEPHSGGPNGGTFGMSFAFNFDGLPIRADDGICKVAVALVEYVHRCVVSEPLASLLK